MLVPMILFFKVFKTNHLGYFISMRTDCFSCTAWLLSVIQVTLGAVYFFVVGAALC